MTCLLTGTFFSEATSIKFIPGITVLKAYCITDINFADIEVCFNGTQVSSIGPLWLSC